MDDSTAASETRPFRFGVVAPLRTDLPTWRDRVHRIADSGYSTLLMPDVPPWQPAPGPAGRRGRPRRPARGHLGVCLRTAPALEHRVEAHSLSVLADGRFEMGIGTGRPGIEVELGLPVVPPSERLAQVRETVTALRDLDGPDLHTPVVMAVRGPKAQALGGRPRGHGHLRTDAGRRSGRNHTGGTDFRAIRDVELAQHVAVSGDTVAPFMAPPTPTLLRFALSLAILPDDPRRPMRSGGDGRRSASPTSSSAPTSPTLAPVVAELAGQ